ncbi:hypothetical protein [Paenibacillus sp. YIM B09110]|uniref:hypothetical protein n=1 Tax=Paenibacillus sp. YIM B09110 TaxID=3126102 RepID=UPI00301CC19E
MSITGLIYISVVTAGLFLLQWKQLRDPKSKAVFAALMVVMWALAVVVAYDPTLPGPYQLVETVIGAWIRDSN